MGVSGYQPVTSLQTVSPLSRSNHVDRLVRLLRRCFIAVYLCVALYAALALSNAFGIRYIEKQHRAFPPIRGVQGRDDSCETVLPGITIHSRSCCFENICKFQYTIISSGFGCYSTCARSLI